MSTWAGQRMRACTGRSPAARWAALLLLGQGAVSLTLACCGRAMGRATGHLVVSGTPLPPYPPQVREGRVGANSKQLSAAARAAIQARWEEVMAPVTGCSSYAEMRRSINRELGRPFGVGGGGGT